ncbi:MAG: MFS transporter [Bauldia sp.]
MLERSPEQRPADTPQASSLKLFLALFPSIMLPMFLAIVDQTIVSAALPAIAGELGQPDRVSWIVVSYLVTATVLAPVYGRVGDVIGRKPLMILALAIFIGASIVCALSTSMIMLTAGRVLQGLGGGGLMTLSHALIGDTVPPRDRARYQGFLAAIAVSSSTFGPVAGGFLTEHFGWRSIFIVNLPIGLLALALTLRLPKRARTDQPFRFDALGLFLFAAFIISTLTMLSTLQRFSSDTVLPVVGLLVLSLATVAALVFHERRVRDPLLPLALLRQPSIWRTDVLVICHWANLVSLLTFLPIFYRVVHGGTPSQIGLLLLPMTAGVGVGSVVTGWLVGRTGRTTLVPGVGLVVVFVLVLTLGLLAPYLAASQVALLLGCAAVFMGTVMSVAQVIVQTSAGPSMIGAASASVQIARTLGAALGTGLVGAVFFGTLAATSGDAAHYFGLMLQQGPGVLDTLSAAQHALIEGQIAGAFRNAFLTNAAFVAIGVVLVWSIPLRRI